MLQYSLQHDRLVSYNSKSYDDQLKGSSKYLFANSELKEREKNTLSKLDNEDERVLLNQDFIDKLIAERDDILSFKNQSETTMNRLFEIQRLISDMKLHRIDLYREVHENRYIHERSKRTDQKKLNKAKVRGKLFALLNLKESRKFMCFITVSFPANSSDSECYSSWNYFLTALRKRHNLTNYVWIAERQKNKTIHYHMITNDRMPVRDVNAIMATIIDNKVKDNKMDWGNSSKEAYNGVDIDSIYNSKRHRKSGKNLSISDMKNIIAAYVTKYVTKNDSVFTHQIWHCSRSVSELFTSQIYNVNELYILRKAFPGGLQNYSVYKNDYCTVIYLNFRPPDHTLQILTEINNIIFSKYVLKYQSISQSITSKKQML